MDVGRREDRFLDHISDLLREREAAVVELRLLALKNPDLKPKLDKIEKILVH